MPYYEYRCPTNGTVLEVRHGMDRTVETWGELAELAGEELGAVAPEAPVERLMSAPAPLPGSAPDAGFQGCGSGCACVSPN